MNFTDEVLKSLNSKIIGIMQEYFLLNPEFIVSINNIEDFGFKVDISYDPINFENYFNLDFLSDKEDELNNLKKLILQYNDKHKKDLVKSIEIEAESRNIKLKKIRDYEKNIKFDFHKIEEAHLKDRKSNIGEIKGKKALILDKEEGKEIKMLKDIELKEKSVMKLERAKSINYREIMVDLYFSFKEKISLSWDSLKIEDLYNDTIKKFEEIIHEAGIEEIILRKISVSIRKPIKEDLDEEINELEKQEKFFDIINKIDEFLENVKLPKEELLNLLITKSAILCDNLKDYKNALKIVERGLMLDDKEVSLYVNKAMILYHQGKVSDALNVINKGLTIEDANIFLLFKKSFLLKEIGDLKSAFDFISEAIKLNDNDQYPMDTLYELKLWILEEQEDFEAVIFTLDNLIEYFPNNVEYYERKYTFQLDNLMNYEDALITIDKAIKIDPNNTSLYLDKSMILCDYLKKYGEALDVVEAGLKINSQAYLLYINKAVILINIDELDESFKAIKQAEKINKYDINVLTRKSFILFSMGDIDEAYNVSKLAMTIVPNNNDLILYHLELIVNLGKFEEGIEIVEHALEDSPENLDLINAFLELCINSGKKKNFNKGLRLAEKVLESGLRDNELYLSKIMLVYNLDRPDEALITIDAAIEFDKNYADHYVFRSAIYAQNNDFKKALEDMDRAISIEADVFQYHISKAWIHYKMKNYKDALKEIEITIELNPKFAESHYQRSLVYFEMEKYEDALSEIDLAIKITPDESDFHDFKIQIFDKIEKMD